MKDLLKFGLIVAAMFYFFSPGVIAMIAGLVALVVVHEFGHWIVARLCGFAVPTFSVGMGSAPRLRLGTFWGTEFQITPWLIGGYVSINPQDETFLSAAKWKRAAVLVAGVVMNVLTAVLIIFVLLAAVGAKRVELQNLSVKQLDQTITIAADAGLQAGDTIVAVDGVGVTNFDQFRSYLAAHKNVRITLGIDRNGEAKEISLVPNADGRIGFQPDGKVVAIYEPRSIGQAAVESVKVTYETTVNMGRGLLIMMKILPEPAGLPAGATDVHGVVAIVQIGATAYDGGLYAFLMMVAMISLNLAFMNILPIPLLDGGHLLFIGLECVGIRLRKETQGFISLLFMFLLLGLMFFGLFNDIFHPIQFK
ncbi:MAG: M50 family metallopeptidase [Candidatus Obscuribacterales bacterium]|nr:M50 family metallopeptidase [Candidatus Obscuribacterales bacterium]